MESIKHVKQRTEERKMKKTYFAGCRCSEDLKELYRKLALANHPDRGGDLETMKTINAEFDTTFERLKNIHRSIKDDATENPYYTAAKATTETAGEFRDIIEALLKMEGTTVELIGRWIWVTGNTKEYKDTLKAMGFKWAAKKLAWSWHKDEDWTSSRGKYSLNDIRGRYGSTQFEKEEEKKRIA
jgi:hypothetical protein